MTGNDELERRIRAEIADTGPIRFDRFMQRALYEPGCGYYVGGSERAGRRGDFVTSPAMSAAFGRTLARLVSLLADQITDGPLRIVDVGAGEGGLLAALAPAAAGMLPDRELQPVAVEVSDGARARARARLGPEAAAVAGPAELTALGAADGVIVANELFDALPVRRLRRNRALEEVWIDATAEGLRESWRPAEPPPDLARLPRGSECAIAVGVEELSTTLASSLARGLLLVIDYGYPAQTLYALDGPGNPVRGFRRGVLVDDLVASPGEIDLTAHVDFSRIAKAGRDAGLETVLFTDQTYLLLALGFLDDPEAAAARRLMHPEDMGGSFKCLLLGKGIDPRPFRALGVRDRRHLLEPAGRRAPHK